MWALCLAGSRARGWGAAVSESDAGECGGVGVSRYGVLWNCGSAMGVWRCGVVWKRESVEVWECRDMECCGIVGVRSGVGVNRVLRVWRWCLKGPLPNGLPKLLFTSCD